MADARAPFEPVRDLRVAVTFLTRLPVGWITGLKGGDLAAAAWAFPLVGVIVGGLAGGALYLAAGADLHPLACALVGLAVQALVTGALHEDGLADVADGLGGGERKRTLEIMRDSRIGTYGVLALVFGVGIRAGALAGVPGPGMAWAAMVGAAALSRAALPLAMAALPPARADGLSRGAGVPTWKGAALALAVGVAVWWLSVPWAAFVAGLLIATAGALAVAAWAFRRLGGHTGDVLGAMQQMIEAALLVGAAGWSLSYG